MAELLEYREITPPPALQLHIKCFWRLRGARSDFATPEPIVPDGCVELVVNLGDPFVRQLAPDTSHLQSSRLVAGQITRAVVVGPSGRLDLWGIRFHPWSAATFLGVSGDEIRDRFFSLDETTPSLARALDHLEEIDGDDARLDAIVVALTARASRVVAPDRLLPALVDTATSGPDAISVNGLARRAGVSTRRVQSLFRQRVGLSPKQLLRIARFQHALGLARANAGLSWSAIAMRAGYYDQAHLIHESNDIVGFTPAALLGRDASLTDAFLPDPA